MFKSLPKKKNPYIICYFQRSRISVYLPARKEVATLEFPPTILADVTVVDQEQFEKAITKLLAQYDVDPGPVLVVLATDVCFVREIDLADIQDGVDKKTAEDIAKELRSSMPYTNVFVRVIRQGKRQLIIALNREFYEPLLAVFREEGFDVTTLIPEFVLAQPIAPAGLTAALAVQLEKMVDKYEEFDLLESQDKPRMIITTAQSPEDQKKTLVLVVVFVVLTLVLVGVWWWTNRSTPSIAPVIPVVSVVSEPPNAPIEESTGSMDQPTPASSDSASLLPDLATSAASVLASPSVRPLLLIE